MSRDQLEAEALIAGRAAVHNLKWMKKHPERFDQSKKHDMETYLYMMIHFSKEEIKNAHRPGWTSLRTRSRNLFVSIIPQRIIRRKGAQR